MHPLQYHIYPNEFSFCLLQRTSMKVSWCGALLTGFGGQHTWIPSSQCG